MMTVHPVAETPSNPKSAVVLFRFGWRNVKIRRLTAAATQE
jgi:hypothetical protein